MPFQTRNVNGTSVENAMLEGMCKEAAVFCFKLLSQNFLRRSEETHKEVSSGRNSKWSANHLTAAFGRSINWTEHESKNGPYIIHWRCINCRSYLASNEVKVWSCTVNWNG